MTARVFSLLLLFATASMVALGQAAQTPPRFDVASIRPSPPSDTPTASVGMRITRSQVAITSLTMADLLSVAFSVSARQIAGPDWIQEARFNVNAVIPGGVSRDDVPA